MSDSERSAAEQAFDVRPETTGEMLARVRETQGRNLRGVANDLRIRFVYLHALEEGRYADLPGQTYAVGFLRTYADYLGLDSVKVVEHYKEEISGLPGGGNLVFPVPEPEGKIPGGLVVIISLLLLALAYGGWYVITSQGDELLALWDNLQQEESSDASSPETTSADTTPSDTMETAQTAEPATSSENGSSANEATQDPVPAPDATDAQQAKETTGTTSDGIAATDSQSEASMASSDEAPAPAPTAAIESSSQETAQATSEPAQETTSAATGSQTVELESAAASNSQGNLNVVVTPTAVVEAEEAAAVAQQTIQAQEESAAIPPAPNGATLGERAPRTYGEVNENARILLQANNDSWVQVRNQQNDVIFTQVLHKGDIYRVPDIAGLTLLTGNAGGLQILVDGKSVPSLGPVGEVRRNVSLSPDALLEGNNGTN